MIQIDIKPLSVNRAWQGKRFKTKEYLSYEKEMIWKLPKINIPSSPLKVSFEFGFSNKLSDFDNALKLTTDILQKKYGFNDRDIYEANIKKVITEKGKEFVRFKIESL